jgi:hypothetical protein
MNPGTNPEIEGLDALVVGVDPSDPNASAAARRGCVG